MKAFITKFGRILKMSKFKKILCVFLSVLLVTGTIAVSLAVDKSNSEPPLKVEITTDKASYGTYSTANFTVKITNVSTEPVSNISAEVSLNNLVAIGKNSQIKKEAGSLASGETLEFSYSAMMSSSPLNFLQKIFMFFVQIFKSILKVPGVSVGNGRAFIEESKTVMFGKYEAGATVRVWFGNSSNDEIILDSSLTQVFVSEEEQTIYLYAKPTRKVSAVAVKDYYTNATICLLFDDGEQEISGDDVANDGIYTGNFSSSYSKEETFNFYATYTDKQNIMSNVVAITVLTGFPDEQLDEMEEVGNTISSLLKSDDFKALSQHDKIESVKSLLNKLATAGTSKMQKPLIIKSSICYDKDIETFSFRYNNGIIFVIDLSEQKNITAPIPQGVANELFNGYFHKGNDTRATNLLNIETDIISTLNKTNLNAIIMYGYGEWGKPSDYQKFEQYYSNAKDVWTEAGLDTVLFTSPTVQTYKTELKNKDLIVFATHGGIVPVYSKIAKLLHVDNFPKGKYPCIAPWEIVTDEKNEIYKLDLNENRVVNRIEQETGEICYGILPSFFEYYYKGNYKLNNSIVYMAACNSFGNGQLIDHNLSFALGNAGASAIIGYHNKMLVGYGIMIMGEFMDRLLKGNTVQKSLDFAMEKWGYTDIEFYNKYNDKGDTLENVPAFPVLDGYGTKKLIDTDPQEPLIGTVAGFVKALGTGEPIHGANIFVYNAMNELVAGALTDANGDFSFMVPEGAYRLEIFPPNILDKYNSKVTEIDVKGGSTTLNFVPIWLDRLGELPTGDDGITPMVSAEYYHTVGLKNDGTVVAVGRNTSGQCNVSDWNDIIAVSTGYHHTVGLKKDGTVVAVGSSSSGVSNVSSWNDIIAVSAGEDHIVGLKKDGTVVAVGRNVEGQRNVSEWNDIIAISAGADYTVGLKKDGTVVAVGNNTSGQCNVSGWNDIIAVSTGWWHTIGLKKDGTVVAVGWNMYNQRNVSGWDDIIAVSGGYYHTVGLKKDVTVVAAGTNSHGQCDVSGWNDIIAVSAGYEHTVGLKKDGTVVAAGSNGNGQCNVSDWDLGASSLLD